MKNRKLNKKVLIAALPLVAVLLVLVYMLLNRSTTTDLQKLVVIDPGHGGNDNGCAYGDFLEKDLNLEVSLLLRETLEERGYKVRMTRKKDERLELQERSAFGNQHKNSMYVSIHTNTTDETETSASGIEIWYNDSAHDLNASFSQHLLEGALAATGAADRGIRINSNFHVIRYAQSPSCLFEMGFMNNTAERNNLQNAAYLEKMAAGIADGIDAFYQQYGPRE